MKIEATICDGCKSDIYDNLLGTRVSLSADDSATGDYEELDFCSRACLVGYISTMAGVD